jgi:hypothetical protein
MIVPVVVYRCGGSEPWEDRLCEDADGTPDDLPSHPAVPSTLRRFLEVARSVLSDFCDDSEYEDYRREDARSTEAPAATVTVNATGPDRRSDTPDPHQRPRR